MSEYKAIHVSNLRGDLKIPFDAYIKINEKYILYCRKGDSFEGIRLERLKKKSLSEMFILQKDEDIYRHYLSQNNERAYNDNSKLDIDDRGQIVQGLQQSKIQDLFEYIRSEDVYDQAHAATSNYLSFLLNEKLALKSILNVKNMDGNIVHHGIAVATIGLSIIQKLNLEDEFEAQLIPFIVGCSLHDFGHQRNAFKINQKLNSLSPTELEAYQKHPEVGAKALNGLTHIDPLVIDIILKHEETVNGEGFPKGLKGSKLSPLVLIAGAANTFDRYTSLEGLSYKEGLKMMLIKKMGAYPLEYMKALQDVLKINGIFN